MNLVKAIEIYVQRKRSEGLSFNWAVPYLRALANQVENVPLKDVTTRDIVTFLDSPKRSPSTWIAKYDLLRSFFDFWLARGETISLRMPDKRKRGRPEFARYIYTQSQLRTMLKAVRRSQKETCCSIDHITLRAILIFLYGTGALVGEALRLVVDDIDMKNDKVTVRGKRSNQVRTIPIGHDLAAVLKGYLVSRRRLETPDCHVFQSKKGSGISFCTLDVAFRRLRRIAGINRTDDPKHQPRLHDLRHTFAVHRITAWIKHGADLNRMLPALAVYMGFVSFRSTEAYLSLTPERFRAQLTKLSPQRGKKKWRDDPELMKFLSALSADGGTRHAGAEGVLPRSIKEQPQHSARGWTARGKK